jgi:hypothetical protein
VTIAWICPRCSQAHSLLETCPDQLAQLLRREPQSVALPNTSMRAFATGATRSSDADKLDYEGFLSPAVLKRYATYMHKHRRDADGKLRDSDNWQKGMPRTVYMKSAWRHFVDVWTMHRSVPDDGRRDPLFEDALCALLFNVMGYLNELLEGR